MPRELRCQPYLPVATAVVSVQVNSREEMITGECKEETKGEHESTYVMMDCVGRSGAKSHGYRNPEDNDVNVARACLGLTSTPFASALDDLGYFKQTDLS